MPIDFSKSEGFITWPDSFGGPAIGVESARVGACVAEMRRRGWRALFATVPFYASSSVDFLRAVPELSALQLYDLKIEATEAIHALKSLSFLRLSGRRPPIDFQAFPKLEHLVVEWTKGDGGYGVPDGALKSLSIWRHKASTGDFSSVEIPTSITDLRIYWSDARSLDGIRFLPNLRHLEIARCRNLESLSALRTQCPNLETLTVTASGRVRESEATKAIEFLSRLHHAYAAGKVLVKSAEPNASVH